jgi:hypothetical protein
MSPRFLKHILTHRVARIRTLDLIVGISAVLATGSAVHGITSVQRLETDVVLAEKAFIPPKTAQQLSLGKSSMLLAWV